MPWKEEPSERDRLVLREQLGRPLRGEVRVVSRCPFGKPRVIGTPPLLPDGTPFPTLFWLTCPMLVKDVSRMESGDLRSLLRERLRDADFADRLKRAEEDYAEERLRWAEDERQRELVREVFSGRMGIGGTVRGGVKCLHAHLAHYLAGFDNPVGEEVFRELPPSRCRGNCSPFLKERR